MASMYFFDTKIGQKALDLARETLESGWVSEGKKVKEFEEALSTHLGLQSPVAVNSGTASLGLALMVAGVKPKDEVILPAQTFVATGMAILQLGADPIFADISPITGNMRPEDFEKRISPRTKAVIPVHWSGYPCDMEEINTIAAKHGVAVIEDAAHALGATYKGKPIGAVSRFTAFSFQAIKHLTCGDGGALCCLDSLDEASAKRRRWFGIDRENRSPSILGEHEFDIDEVGYKFHMNDLAASVGLGNLETLPLRLNRHREIARRYFEALVDIPGLQLPEQETDRESSFWFFPVKVDRREDFVRSLATRDVPASVVHRRIDRFAVFGGMRTDLPGQAEYDQRQVALPVHSSLTDRDVDQVIAAVAAGW